MKKLFSFLPLILLCGCGFVATPVKTPIKDPSVVPIVHPITNSNGFVIPATNYYKFSVVTNDLGVTSLQSNAVATPFIIITNQFVINPYLDKGLTVAKAVNEAVPTPWTTYISWGLTAIAGLATGYVNRKNNTLNNYNQALITGVEAVNNPDTKAAIKKEIGATGQSSSFHDLVQSVVSAM